MTLDTFKSAVRSYWRLEILRGTLFMALLGVAAFPTIFVVRRLDVAGFDGTTVAVVSASYMVIAALMFYVVSPLRKRHLERLRAGCPACSRMLLGRHSQSVITTGRCPACGSQVLQ
jgi:hypothetical protein